MQQRKTNRVEKVNSLVQHLLAEELLRYTVNLKGIVTISKVECSRDLRWAKVWITVVNGDDEATMNTFKNHLYEIQGELNRRMEMKIVPRISFYLDTSARYAQRINKLFKDIEEERTHSDHDREDGTE